jgi:hypothetical protein
MMTILQLIVQIKIIQFASDVLDTIFIIQIVTILSDVLIVKGIVWWEIPVA